MVELIVTMDKKGGIGYQNCHPWFCEKEREIFTPLKIYTFGHLKRRFLIYFL